MTKTSLHIPVLLEQVLKILCKNEKQVCLLKRVIFMFSKNIIN